MPRIKAFCGIRPGPEYGARLPVPSAAFEEQAAAFRTDPCSFLHLLSPELENNFLRGSREELIYRQASENLSEFLEKGYLLKDEQPCLYLYSIWENERVRTGIWTVTLFDDYLNNHIRKHEFTRPEREARISAYIKHTGIDPNPVLIAYPGHADVDQVLQRELRQEALLFLPRGAQIHTLHRVSCEESIRIIVDRFAAMPSAYLADGHHRAAAFSSYGVERRKFNFRHSGLEEYNYFSSLYFKSEDLEMKAFYRVVKDLNGLGREEFLAQLSHRFHVLRQGGVPRPARHTFGMYLPGQWYLLQPRERIRETDPVKQLDVSILQESVLCPLLGIADPRTDSRLSYAGADEDPVQLEDRIRQGEAAVLFSLFPTTIGELIAVADAGLAMPPKSTWFEPKLDLGILTHYID